MSMKTIKPSKRILKARTTFLDAIGEACKDLTPEEMLAVLSYTVGQCLALQNQNEMTPQEGLAIINLNVQQGNVDAVHHILSGPVAGNA